jgi:hypothetical protein
MAIVFGCVDCRPVYLAQDMCLVNMAMNLLILCVRLR